VIKYALGNFETDAKLRQARSERHAQVVQTNVEQCGIPANPFE
jgi:hypothetical protein